MIYFMYYLYTFAGVFKMYVPGRILGIYCNVCVCTEYHVFPNDRIKRDGKTERKRKPYNIRSKTVVQL